MRFILLTTGLAAALALSGCEQPSEKTADASVAAPAKKSLGRQRQMYQGQEPIQSVQSGAIAVAENPQNLTLTVTGMAPGPGYTRGTFLTRIYPAAPKDGIYEVDVVAEKPAAGAAATPTPIEIKGEWPGYPAERLKGVRFISATNDITVMLPAAAPAP